MERFYSWQVLKVEWNRVCYNILSYYSDGSFDDYEAMVWLNEDENIADYVREHYGKTLFDCEAWYHREWYSLTA